MEQYRRFMAFRKLHPALAKGEIEFTLEQGPVLGFERRFGNETLLCYLQYE